MDDLKNNKIFWVVVIFTVLNLGGFFVSKFLISKTTDKVIERLQKEYSPSPYGPGLDPDKLDPDKLDPESLKNQKVYFELKKNENQDVVINQSLIWRQDWEQDRGFAIEP